MLNRYGYGIGNEILVPRRTPGSGIAGLPLPKVIPSTEDITITAVNPPGPVIQCKHWDGLSVITKTTLAWKFTQRIRRQSITEYQGYDPYTLVVPLYFGDPLDPTVDVDPQIAVLEGLMHNAVGPRVEPAVCQIICPLIPHTELLWVVQDFDFSKTTYRDASGQRYFCQIDVTFLEWQPTNLSITSRSLSPAQLAAAAASSSSVVGAAGPSSRTYTVQAGDTLQIIAAKLLGGAAAWAQIGRLNGIRDNTGIKVGQVLRIPLIAS